MPPATTVEPPATALANLHTAVCDGNPCSDGSIALGGCRFTGGNAPIPLLTLSFGARLAQIVVPHSISNKYYQNQAQRNGLTNNDSLVGVILGCRAHL